MNVLFLKKFNNYFNRIVYRFETLTDYQDRASNYVNFASINFNPNDGINTELIVGNENQKISGALLDWDTAGSPDYLVCYETSSAGTPPVITNTIISRWFIIECQRTRSGQFKLTLKRDTIADHLDEVRDSACYIEKGIVESIEDSAIYNKEQITTNQIKSDEFLLKDETQCPWIVGYVARDRNDNGTLEPVTFTSTTIPGVEANDNMCDEIYSDWDEFYTAHPELNGELATLNGWSLSVQLDIWYRKLISHYRTGQTVTLYSSGEIAWKESEYKGSNYLYSKKKPKLAWKGWLVEFRKGYCPSLINNWTTDAFKQSLVEQIANKEGVRFVDESTIQSFFNYVKKDPVIKIGSKYYRVTDKYSEVDKSTIKDSSFINIGTTAYDLANSNLNREPRTYFDKNPWDPSHDTIEGTAGSETYKVEWDYNKHSLQFKEVFAQCKVKIPATTPVLKDAPYYMFAIPYSDDLALYDENTLHCTTNSSVAMNAAQTLAQKTGVGVVYDVQLLPYCPIRDIIKTEKISAHSEIVSGTFNTGFTQILETTPTPPHYKWITVPYMKVNHKYILSKNIMPFDSENNVYSWPYDNVGTRLWCRLAQIGTTPTNIIIKVGSDFENIEDYTVYKGVLLSIEFDSFSTSSSVQNEPIIRLYNNIIGTGDPIFEMSYLDYIDASNSNLFIQIEITDSVVYGAKIWDSLGLTPFWVSRSAKLNPSGGKTINPNNLTSNKRREYIEADEIFNWLPSFLDDYIYYEDYYLSKIDINNSIHSDIVKFIDGVEGDIVNTLFWCTDSKFTFNKFMDNYFLLQADGTYKEDAITELINDRVKRGSTIEDIKIKNQIDMLRLASPNYSNFFDMNIQRNNGIEYINIDCTYKPYQPYIHLNPNFKGLYGADYNDVRGLICGGDYSIATTTDAWATYQLQNKNYQAVFDRQIQQLEVQQDVQRQGQIAGAVAGVGVGTISGAVAGGTKGGIPGAIAGAVVGAVGSTFGGIADVSNSDRLRELQISTMKDIHYANLENIKALPFGLSKTSYLTNNNKIFPFLEFYTCTPTEEMAVRSLLYYNGMTINRIGKIRDFQSDDELPYIKGKLLRIDLEDDAHHVKDIADELALGVYLPDATRDVEEEEEEEEEIQEGGN